MSITNKIYMVSFLCLVLFVCLLWVIKYDGERAKLTQKEQEAKIEYISDAPASAGATARVAPPDGRRLFSDYCSGCHAINPSAAPSGMNVAGVGSRMSKVVLRTLMLDPPPPMEPWPGEEKELDALVDYLASLTTGRSYPRADIIALQPEEGLPGHLGGKAGYDTYITRCNICHQINVDEPGGGLNLAGLGKRLDKDTIRLVIANPHAGMPDWTGTAEELISLVEFISGLTESAGTMPGYKAGMPGESQSGSSLYQAKGCNACHSFTPGEPLTLAGVGSKLSRSEIQKKTKTMPGWDGDEAELDTITDYLAAMTDDGDTVVEEGEPAEEESEEEVEPVATGKPDAKAYYAANCAMCHPTEGEGGGLNLAGIGSRLGASRIENKITSPPGGMPPWTGTDDEFDAVVFYLMGLKSTPVEEEPEEEEVVEVVEVEEEAPAPPAAGGDAAKGEEYYQAKCGFCHQTTGEGGGANLAGLSSRLSMAEIREKIVSPPGGMTDWTGSDGELQDVLAYLLSL